jgi:methyltransferase-like protein/2-polyprenyl-3-methyl-5-hydroxy-6-metoxy-1,4-benzoquinol methylase
MTNSNYDEVPYESFPYPNTHPEQLYTIGKLFNLDAPSPKECRVLELGCAGAGNIIPMAIKFPKSEFVGIDLSTVQINEGKKHAEKLGIKNLELKNTSIMDIDESFGKFDYIIAHGILSWVSKEIQDKIFEICDKNLSENGISYISYNTLPGWNAIKSIREMMLYHTQNFTDTATKTKQARMLLHFIKKGNGDHLNPYAQVIQNEIDTLANTGDFYLAHDHLEDNNEPFYFHEFMARANNNNLQYLGDSAIATMFSGNFPPETAEILNQVSNDIVRAEQYMDFVRNRRFRSTLLCHKNIQLNRSLNPQKIKDFYVYSRLKADKQLTEINVTSNEEVTFSAVNGVNFATSNRVGVAALLYLSEQNEPISVKKLIDETNKRLGREANKEVTEAIVLENVLRLALADGVVLHAFPANYTTKPSEKPKVSELLRYQATYANWVTSQRAEKLDIDPFSRVLVQYLDGNNDVATIIDKMVNHVVNNDLVLSFPATGQITDKAAIKSEVAKITKSSLSAFAPNALLVA